MPKSLDAPGWRSRSRPSLVSAPADEFIPNRNYGLLWLARRSPPVARRTLGLGLGAKIARGAAHARRSGAPEYSGGRPSGLGGAAAADRSDHPHCGGIAGRWNNHI